MCCLRYCKCTSFQANHNAVCMTLPTQNVVCDTANVRVFKQITTSFLGEWPFLSCLRYCKCTSFQANHNTHEHVLYRAHVVCDTANVRVFKQITTTDRIKFIHLGCLRYCKCTSFQANHNA